MRTMMLPGRRKSVALSTLVLATAIVVTGCSTISDVSGEVTSATIALETKVTDLDPNGTTSVVSLQVMALLAGTLIELTPEGLQPGLAESWEPSEDGLTFTVQLKDDLKFSDGSDLTVKDVLASWAYFLDDEANVNSGQIASIESVTEGDAGSVVFSLSTPFPSLDNVLTRASYLIMPADRLADPEFMLNPVSAGPYSLAEWGGTDTIKLVRNAHYVGKTPVLEELIFLTITEAASRIAQLQSGQVDLASNLPSTVINELTSPIVVSVVPQYGGTYIYMNNRQGPLSEVGVRQAISRAIDRAEISKISFDNKAPVMDSFFPSTMSGYMSAFPVDRDVAAAKQWLEGTSCENGCTIQLLMRSATTQAIQQMGVIIQQQLADIGIQLQISQVDDSVWGEALGGSFEMTIDSLSDAADIPDAMLTYGVISDGGIEALFSGYSSTEMDSAARKVIASSGSEREAALKTVGEIFAEDMPFVPLVELVYINASDLPGGLVYQMPSGNFDVERR